MRFNDLYEQDLIPPGAPGPDPDDLESVEDARHNAIRELEDRMEQMYFRAFQQVGIDMSTADGSIPVSVTFYEKDQNVEVTIWPDDSILIGALNKLVEAGFLNANAELGGGTTNSITITQNLPAANTPFRQFLNLDPGTGSVVGSSNS